MLLRAASGRRLRRLFVTIDVCRLRVRRKLSQRTPPYDKTATILYDHRNLAAANLL